MACRFIDFLRPENWHENEWFQVAPRAAARQRATSTACPRRSSPAGSCHGLELVVKWSRVGEDVPLNTFTLGQAINAEFNSPFEEFSLVEALRTGVFGKKLPRVLTQKPLAIYVPPERMQLWQTGRSRDRIMRKIARHASIEIDILRSYILLYGWIKGINAVDGYRIACYDEASQKQEMESLTRKVAADLKEKGFFRRRPQATHFIVRMRDGKVRRGHGGGWFYALVDYELLARTPRARGERQARPAQRYLFLQRRPLQAAAPRPFPPALRPACVMGVDYIYGRAESTAASSGSSGRTPTSSTTSSRALPDEADPALRRQAGCGTPPPRTASTWSGSLARGRPAPGRPARPGLQEDPHPGLQQPLRGVRPGAGHAGARLRTFTPAPYYVTAQTTESPGNVLDARRFERSRRLLSRRTSPSSSSEPTTSPSTATGAAWRMTAPPDDVGLLDPHRRPAGVRHGDSSARRRCARSWSASAPASRGRLRGCQPQARPRSLSPTSRRQHQSASPDGTYEMRHCNLEMVRRI